MCHGCQSLIQAPTNPCQICAKPLNQPGGICGECRSDPPAFSQTICAAIYEPPVSTWVQQLKFGNRMDRARIMAEALLKPLQAIDNNIPIIPVPLHPKRLRHRGYNQAHEIAKIIAKRQNRPLLSDALIRTKNTAMQAELHEKQRANNVRAAFAVNQPIESDTVIVLDDVMTTGQTLRSVAKCLNQAGVDEVIVAVFARSGA
ncbi:ComF family protein [Marinicella litoralis]|uniref:ComF family protein n=1 Tax=Marinicella litoralis TaxID=644220 RepID=A0A4V3DI36_9GAMM|nr:ComF family protein [Marinicella litoralis]